MKKILVILFVLLPLMASAQYFELSPNGFVSVEDTAKTFVVIPMDGTKAELYNKAKTAIMSMWNSPKDVMSYNEPEIIVINGFTGSLYVKTIGITTYFDMNYRMQLQFKDGKLKIDAPGADKAEAHGKNGTMYFCKGGGQSMLGITYVFDKKGKLKQKDFKKQLEDYFNGLIQSLVEKMQSGTTSDDW